MGGFVYDFLSMSEDVIYHIRTNGLKLYTNTPIVIRTHARTHTHTYTHTCILKTYKKFKTDNISRLHTYAFVFRFKCYDRCSLLDISW